MSSKVFTASLLVAGTAIGAGMLALPVASGPGGFWPSILIYLICWLYSTATGLLLFEACLWLPKDSNLVSLSHHLLGKAGRAASWFLYIFFFYCLVTAYISYGSTFFPFLSKPLASLLFVAIFSPIVYLGTKAVDRINFLLMVGLIASFLVFLAVGFEKIELERLNVVSWPPAILALPVMLASFSYQGIVPSIRNYFHGSPKNARKAIIIGSSIPFFVYVLWQFFILGIIPLDQMVGAESAIEPLRTILTSKSIYLMGHAFAFFALTSSFLGVTLGLFDFLADGFKLKKKGGSKILLYLLVYVPPLLIAMSKPGLFLDALSFAGGFGAILLLGLIPILMVWSGRYFKSLKKTPQLFGGRLLLLILIAFVIFEIGVQVTKML